MADTKHNRTRHEISKEIDSAFADELSLLRLGDRFIRLEMTMKVLADTDCEFVVVHPYDNGTCFGMRCRNRHNEPIGKLLMHIYVR